MWAEKNHIEQSSDLLIVEVLSFKKKYKILINPTHLNGSISKGIWLVVQMLIGFKFKYL